MQEGGPPLVAAAGDIVLLIEAKPDGIFLYEFRPDGFIGDTWHRSVEEAMAQAASAWGCGPADWRALPPGEPDPVRFARRPPQG